MTQHAFCPIDPALGLKTTKTGLFDLTQMASLAVDGVELLLIGPFLITGAGYYKQSPPPT